MRPIHIIGAGLAGSECAYQLAEMGHKVVLHEMRQEGRPESFTPAHKTHKMAELVCSNSFGSQTMYSAPGQLKWEAAQMGSLILKAAKKASVPAGMALGIDREILSDTVTSSVEDHPNIQVKREKITRLNDLPRPLVVATGPLTDTALAEDLRQHFENEFLYFFDAIAPIIDADSINMDIAYIGDRFGKGTGDYINCPLNKDKYYQLIEEIQNARKIESKDFEKEWEDTPYFEGCMPIEEMIRRGPETPRFGPMSPKGLQHGGPDEYKHAVVQLRKENKEGTAYNMVGFQTKMAYGEQKRIFQMIPGLEDAEFLKLGSIHRNMYIHSPKQLNSDLSSRRDHELFFAGQISGVEGYFESTCVGLMVAHFVHAKLNGSEPIAFPRASALGSLINAITEEKEHFQPTNINFSLMPTIENMSGRKNKRLKREKQIERAQKALLQWLDENNEVDALAAKNRFDFQHVDFANPNDIIPTPNGTSKESTVN